MIKTLMQLSLGNNLSTKTSTLEYNELLQSITERTQNDIVIFGIIILIALVVFFIPFYIILSKNKKEARKDTLAEEKLIIDVVTANTEAFSALKTIMTTQNETLISILHNIEEESRVSNDKMLAIKTNQANLYEKVVDSIENSQDLMEVSLNLVTTYIDGKLEEIDKKLDRVSEKMDRNEKIIEEFKINNR